MTKITDDTAPYPRIYKWPQEASAVQAAKSFAVQANPFIDPADWYVVPAAGDRPIPVPEYMWRGGLQAYMSQLLARGVLSSIFRDENDLLACHFELIEE